MRLPSLVAPLVLALAAPLAVPILSGAQPATPIATPVGLAPATDPLLDVVLEDLSAESYDIRLERWRFPPGLDVVTGDAFAAPSALVVDVGTIAATLETTEQTLAAGTQLVVPRDQAQVFGNAGPAEAVMLWVTLAPGGAVANATWDPLAITFQHVITTYMATLADPSRVILERITLPPGTMLPPYAAGELERLAIEVGRLGLTLEGEGLPTLWDSGREQTLVATQDPPQLMPGWWVTLRNDGEESLVLLRLRILSAGAGTPSAATAGTPVP
jgi:hypothetical protein